MIDVDLNYMPAKTKMVFERLAESNFMKKYTLVGGTGLAIQIKHRESEDLDFVFDGELLNTNTIKRNIHALFDAYRIIKQDYNFQIDFIINETKVTFFSTGAVLVPFSVKNFSFKYHKINIAHVEIIAALKFAAISQRTTIRDYYDLYFISKYYTDLEKLILKTKELLPNLSAITYTETLIYVDDIPEDDLSNHLNPKEKITKNEIADFLSKELKKIIKKI